MRTISIDLSGTHFSGSIVLQNLMFFLDFFNCQIHFSVTDRNLSVSWNVVFFKVRS